MTRTREDSMEGKAPDEESWDSCLAIAFGKRVHDPMSVLGRFPTTPTAVQEPSDPSARICGRLELRGELARGAVGIVYEAFDADLGRRVAVKVLHEHLLEHGELVRRFLEEAQIGAQLQHPGIVPVYDMGLDQAQRPWFAMKLVRGRSWSEILKEREHPGTDLPRMLRVFAQVCQTIAYAHARGVVHRDLKPVHVMVGTFGEIQVMDWGFAKVLGRNEPHDGEPVSTVRSPQDGGSTDGLASMAGAALGTPAYMSPEQARGEVDDIDARSDVFGLGAILCEVLTGRAPYAGDDVLEQARRADLASAIDLLQRQGVDPQLARLAQSCLSERAEDRPSDGEAVALAIEDYLSGIEERAREAELVAAASEARLRGERRARHFGVALTISVSALLLLTLGWFYYRSNERALAGQEIEVAIDTASTQLQEQDLASALQSLQRAEGLVQASALEVGVRSAFRGRVVELQRRTRSQILDKRILDLRSSTVRGPRGVADYERAFAEMGLAVTPQAMQVWASNNDPRDHQLLARALEDWHSRTGPQDRRRTDLLSSAQVLDDDPRRRSIRVAWLGSDRIALREEIAKIDDETPVQDLVLLGLALHSLGEDRRTVTLLRNGIELYPADLWLRVALIRILLLQHPPQIEAARVHARVAANLHPDRNWRAIPELPPRPQGPQRSQGPEDRRLGEIRRLWDSGEEFLALDRLDTLLRDHPRSSAARRWVDEVLSKLKADDKVLIDLLKEMRDR